MKQAFGAFGLSAILAATGCAGASGIVDAPAGQRAQSCRVGIADPAALTDAFRDTRSAAMDVGNDGGWCGWYARLSDVDGGPTNYLSAAIAQPPTHGTLRVRRDADRVHIEYQPAAGYVGSDTFAVRLNPGNSLHTTNVTVTQASVAATATVQPEAGVTSSVTQLAPLIYLM